MRNLGCRLLLDSANKKLICLSFGNHSQSYIEEEFFLKNRVLVFHVQPINILQFKIKRKS